MLRTLKVALIGGASMLALATPALADEFDIPGGTLETALNTYTAQTGVSLVVSNEAIRGVRSHGVQGNLAPEVALSRILADTGFVIHRHPDGAVTIVRGEAEAVQSAPVERMAEAAPARAAASVETVVVTSSKIKGDIQTVPIAITALSQEQLTTRQIAGGPDLVKEVPNLTFSKTNFSGYTIQIRGIGTQAISVTTDPAVAVALNDIPFIRNHFFEQEFFDVNQVEVLRGPQGTLYGRNATAGVVNVISAKPTDQFEAMLSADFGNFTNRRYEGMVNIPIVDDRLDLRIAGEWTKRDGYSINQNTGNPIDGRDLWSSRVTLGWKPASNVQAYLVWEHFSEDDDRMRTAKQLCKTDPIPAEVGGVAVPGPSNFDAFSDANYLSQGCQAASLYSPDSFEVPNGRSLPYYEPLGPLGVPIIPGGSDTFDVFANTTQSTNLRVIESSNDPIYKAKNDTLELNVDYTVVPELTVSSQTGYNHDLLWSTEDYNRFDTSPGAFPYHDPTMPYGNGGPHNPSHNGLYQLLPDPGSVGICTDSGGGCTGGDGAYCDQPGVGGCTIFGIFCDPQLGCSNRLVAQDLNDEKSWQLSQEFRLASNFSGPFNFSIGGNYLHYETDENYYVFINSLTLAGFSWNKGADTPCRSDPWVVGVSDNSNCLSGFENVNPNKPALVTQGVGGQFYLDPNPLGSLNNEGHNYFLSQNPYTLNSYAGFGEAYYSVTPDLKLTGGIRWTDDQKHFTDIPSELLVPGYGYPVSGVVNQEWNQLTGRAAVNWSPKLDFTDQTLLYGSFSHGYKAGGANPPGATLLAFQITPNSNVGISNPIHPLTFKPEFIDAYELGTKNTLLDGGLTLNGDVFFYNYTGYQISRIVDRTAINDNFNATVRGAELEATYEPLAGLKFNFAGGYEATRVDNGQSSVDLIDRADLAEHPDWIVVKPFVGQASNCVLPTYVVAGIMKIHPDGDQGAGSIVAACSNAYGNFDDPVTDLPYVANPTLDNSNGDITRTGFGYTGFDPLAGTPGDPYTGQNTYNGHDYGPAPNNGEGFAKNLSGNELPNAPHFTVSLSGDYTIPVSEDWAATLHSDFYWQSQSWARIFNDRPYDKLRGYSTTNVALILTSAAGWQVMGYVKNVFDVTAITGDFLNSDDSGLTTNVFLTDPRLYGLRITKNW